MRVDRHDCDDVVIVGLGTLGSMVFQLVAREAMGSSGCNGTVFLVDPDVVLPHNLSKSAIYEPADGRRHKVAVAREWAKRVNPDLNVIALPEPVQAVGLGPFLRASVVFVCADTYLGKMVASRRAWRAGVPVIMFGEFAGGHSLDSRFRHYRPGREVPCLECNWGEEYDQLAASFPCSPPDTEARREPATRLSVAARTAAWMVEEVERLLQTGALESPAREARLHPTERRFIIFRPRRNPACRFDHAILNRQAVRLLHDGPTPVLGEAFALATDHLPGIPHLRLEQMVTTRFACAAGHEWPCLRRQHLTPPECPICSAEGIAVNQSLCLTIDGAGGLLDTPLVDNIVPPGGVITFVNGDESIHLALAPPVHWHGSGETTETGVES